MAIRPRGCFALRLTTGFSTSSSRSTSSIHRMPTRHWLATVETGVNYAIVVSTCAGMWAHVIGDTVRFESLDPPLLTFTGRTRYSLSAFGEHLINEEVEAAMAAMPWPRRGLVVRDWHVGRVFSSGRMGHHLLVVEFLTSSRRIWRGFRDALDRDLSRRNADYRAHRTGRRGLPLPAVVVAATGGFEAWMRARASSAARTRSRAWTAPARSLAISSSS